MGAREPELSERGERGDGMIKLVATLENKQGGHEWKGMVEIRRHGEVE